MKRLPWKLSTVIFLIVVTGVVIRSTPIPALDIDRLTKDSTLIVTGEILSVNEKGRTKIQFNEAELDVRTATGLIRVDQTLKGNAPVKTAEFKAYIPDTFIGWALPTPNLYSVLFLKEDPSGSFTFTSAYSPFIATIPGEPVTNGTAIEKVVGALKRSLSSPQSSVNQKSMTIFYLSRSKSSAATAALRDALNDSTREIQLSAAGALLERNDTSGLQDVKETLLHRQKDISDTLRQNLSYAIAEGVRDPKAIPVLRELAFSSDATVRRAAASSLMHTRSPEAIASLKSLLDDTDFEARYYAVVGLAETTNQMDWRPNMDAFRADEDKYLRHWRDWSQN